MEKDPTSPHIPSFPFNHGPKSIFGMVGNVISLLRCKTKMWENGRIVIIDVPVNSENAKKLLPLGIRLHESNRASFCIADYEKTAFTTSYRECFLLFHVRSRIGGAGVHCPWMVVNDDSALIYGRELLAYPKKMGEISFAEEGGMISSQTVRRGVKLSSVKLNLLEKETDPQPVTGVKIFNTGGMGQFLSFNLVWFFKFVEHIHEVRRATAQLEIVDSPYDPIKNLLGDIPHPLAARVARVDIFGWRYMLPVSLTGPWNFANTFEYKFR